ncbi:MAG TPA: HAMP domain-containing sensor histidine kinase [Kofleriaceae bacterium]|nr:HAMP domain-containing sensor histidine kinase [Kofleriaceae bacterium]
MERRDTAEERERTDKSLERERTRTDHELATRAEASGEQADEVIQIARERAAEVLAIARAREDRHAPLTAEEIFARAAEDAVLANEYEAADLALRDERERRRLAVRQLLALERRATDVTLMLERASVDDTMVERAMVDVLVHDLRSMLSAVSLSAASIVLAASKGQPLALIVELAMQIQRATAQSDVLLGDLQDLATMAEGRMRITPATTDIVAVVRTAIEINQAAAAANGVALTAHLPADPVAASLDAPRFMRVVVNLLTNVLKFTPRGGSITVEVTRRDAVVEVAVSDTGPGIPEALHETIFERFRRGPHVRARGLGLGLFIAREIVAAHGGRIWVESTPGTGSTFRVQVPAA